MDIPFDLTLVRTLQSDLAKAGRSLDNNTAGRILKDAAQPLLVAERQEVPVGGVPQFKTTTVQRGTRKGQVRNSGSYTRGGALRRSLRLLIVPGEGSEATRVLAGASKAGNNVGWRAHYPIFGTVKMQRNDFQSRAFDRTYDVVLSRLGTSAQQIVKQILAKYTN